jgi:hypothetical protein
LKPEQRRGHFFTPQEASRKLPAVRALVARIVELKRQLDAGGPVGDGGEHKEKEEVGPITRGVRTSEEAAASAAKTRSDLADELGATLSKLEELGVELKDMDSGLVDFPAIKYGEPVYLCWKLGEEDVLYWHQMTDGFRGRKSLRPETAQIR